MIDLPDQPEPERNPFVCIRCGLTIHNEQRYVYCSDICQQADVPTEPGRGGVRS